MTSLYIGLTSSRAPDVELYSSIYSRLLLERSTSLQPGNLETTHFAVLGNLETTFRRVG